MKRGVHRNRARVRVRSFVTGLVIRYVSELEARQMCDEDSKGERLYLREPDAWRLSKKKQPLTDIKLVSALRSERPTEATLTFRDVDNNAMAKGFKVLGGPEISIRALDRAEDKVEAWPEVHDDKAVVICAGKVHGVTFVSNVEAL